MDFNNDGDFVDAGETLLVANNKKGTYSKSIAIPSGVSGTTRMRVSMKTGGAQSSCDDNFNGEVEDYNVIFGSRATAIEPVTDNGLKVEIYPNPASGDELHLEVSKSDYQIAVRIYNKAGMLIGHFETNNKHSIVDTSEYPVGIYFIEVSAGNEVVVNKFIKM